jgi:xanthine/uracil permease
LGFLGFITVVIVEIFGSASMRNASIAVGLLFPLVVAGPLGYISGEPIKAAKPITFLWTTTFKLRIYGPGVLPLLAVYISLMMEAIGDITATSEISKVEVDGLAYDRRISGGVLADGLGGALSALCTVPPLSVFAQVSMHSQSNPWLTS